MDHEDEPKYEKRPRAGLIPYMRMEDGSYQYLMMVASDIKFGGPRPMISKGKIEKGETALHCAIREAEEELGFKPRNARGDYILLYEGRVVLTSGAYDLTVYAVEIQDRYDFDKWCDETEYTVWLDAAEFAVKGRKDHIKFIQELERRLR
jgi:8-oxo-dGTP pyrophosphatase MutT (NUDIX family)